MKRKRVEDKIPELLADGPLTVPENLYDYQQARRKVSQAKRRDGTKYRTMAQKIVDAVEDFENWICGIE